MYILQNVELQKEEKQHYKFFAKFENFGFDKFDRCNVVAVRVVLIIITTIKLHSI